MTSSAAFTLPDNGPTLFLHTKTTPDNTLKLTVESADDEVRDLLSLAPELELEGLPAEHLFGDDQLILDEWLEFLLKSKKDPERGGYDVRDGNVVSRITLQFFQGIKKWIYTVLSFDLDDGRVEVVFIPPRNDRISLGLRHLTDIKQSFWLGNFMNGEGNWEIDLPSRTVLVSRRLSQTLKIGDRARIVPLDRFLKLVHPDDLQAVTYAMENEPLSHEMMHFRVILDDGTLLHFNSFAIPSYDENGSITRIIGRSQNVTERENALDRLSISEQRFRGIVESSQDLFIVINPDKRISYVSPNIKAVSGYSPEEVMGKSFCCLIANPEDESRMAKEFMTVLDGGAFTRGEYQVRRADGSVVWFLVRMSAIFEPGEKIAEVVVVCRDVTEEKKHEEYLQYASLHDSLTGVYNRFYFDREMDRIRQQRIVNFGLILTDLNGLKLVNDAFGHQKGDEMLIEAAHCLSEIDETERHPVSRIGGDEFSVFVFDCTLDRLRYLCDRIHSACRKTADRLLPLSISLGSAYRSDTTQNLEVLFRQAEGRMYSHKMQDSRRVHNQVLGSLKAALTARNIETSDHTQRMDKMMRALGARIGLRMNELEGLSMLASMHDIGKVAIPDYIVNKPGKLSDEEWIVMRTHSEVGCRIAMASQELSSIANEICCHHERWDGSGYPYGYSGSRIPLLSRIISVVDAYDVMAHKSVYKSAVNHKTALDELLSYSGKQFDPEIVGLFLDIFGAKTQGEMQYILEGE